MEGRSVGQAILTALKLPGRALRLWYRYCGYVTLGALPLLAGMIALGVLFSHLGGPVASFFADPPAIVVGLAIFLVAAPGVSFLLWIYKQAYMYPF
ncbi:MAG: hypothetical protein C4523_20575 [Myxococcales bacterium]|nr:MAG: hypothetical protein C4523_20575 [Myxococcales bacterium]